MTSNQIQNRKVAMEESMREAELREQRRSNREREKQQDYSNKTGRMKAVADVVGIGLKAMPFGKRGRNDASWYNESTQLVKDAASISFHTPLGGPINIGNVVQTRQSSAALSFTMQMPGIMRIKWINSMGPLTSDGKAVNGVAAVKKLYSFVRHSNSGHVNYEATDLWLYCNAVVEAFSYAVQGMRAYSIACTTKTENRYYLYAMLRAAGFEASSLIDNLANFRAKLNIQLVRLNALNIPADWPILQRRVWMGLNIFKDFPVKKSAEYMFVQDKVYRYADTSGSLDPYPAFDSTPIKWDVYLARLEQCIDWLLASEDIGIMSGDIEKAYGEDSCAKFDLMPEQFHIESVYHAEVLAQIEGADLVGQLSDDSIYVGQRVVDGETYLVVGGSPASGIVTGQGYVLMDTNIGSSSSPTYVSRKFTDHIVNMYKDDVNPDDVMVATRLSVATNHSQNKEYVAASGTEIALTATIYWFDANMNIHDFEFQGRMISGNGENNVSITTLDAVNKLCKFDWHPRVLFITNIAQGLASASFLEFEDLCNFAKISPDNLATMHNVAIMSLYRVSFLNGKSVNIT